MEWWTLKPRKINLIFEENSWIRPYIISLAEKIRLQGDKVSVFENYELIEAANITFFLGCTKIATPEILIKSEKNLVVHESDLPNGRGFSPLTWQILEGKNSIPVELIEINEYVDAGNIIYKEYIDFIGHELNAEIKKSQGNKTIDLCLKYLSENTMPIGVPQIGEPTYYKRRTTKDSILSVDKTIREQFNLLRVVDNERYPAYFEILGNRYKLMIDKDD